jgi:hypothetical protein
MAEKALKTTPAIAAGLTDGAVACEVCGDSNRLQIRTIRAVPLGAQTLMWATAK